MTKIFVRAILILKFYALKNVDILNFRIKFALRLIFNALSREYNSFPPYYAIFFLVLTDFQLKFNRFCKKKLVEFFQNLVFK